jgi:hypothetical protein
VEVEARGSGAGGQFRQIVLRIPISKETKAKWIGGMAQAVEYLLCKP